MRSMDGADSPAPAVLGEPPLFLVSKISQRDAYLLFHDLKSSHWPPFKCSVFSQVAPNEVRLC